VTFLTLSFPRAIDDAERRVVDAAVAAHNGTIRWRTSARLSRSYGLVEVGDAGAAAIADASTDAAVCDRALIAFAVFPTVPEALPHLAEALGNDGRPAGVVRCAQLRDAVVVEWDPEMTHSRVLFAVIDAELRRFSSGRTVEILSPVTTALSERVAAGGLGAPQIARDRVLEELLERAGLTSDV
jgi:hypothetical protein